MITNRFDMNVYLDAVSTVKAIRSDTRWVSGASMADFLKSLNRVQLSMYLVTTLIDQIDVGGLVQWVNNGYSVNMDMVISVLEEINTPVSKRVISILGELQSYLSQDGYWLDVIPNLDHFDNEFYTIKDFLLIDLVSMIKKIR